MSTLAFYGVLAALYVLAAGRFDLPAFWCYLAVVVGSSLAIIPVLARRSPGLLEERMRPGPGERDRISIPAMVGGLVASWLVAALDTGRFRGSGGLPFAVQGAAWIGVVAGYAIVAWAMLVNRFFSSAVRHQADRAQTVVTAGPYAWVRHPGYTGGLLFLLATPVALGSWWAVLPIVPVVLAVVRRTGLEDAMLQRELEGYAGYARRVRFRLVPGVW
ncbi:MAG TPA: isoprenylcysteine carboxylmethyltransferase family protein [Candidatus Eisenbacteria bacterium]